MAQQAAIAAGDHRVGIPQEGHDGIAMRGDLPLIAVHRPGSEDGAGDLQQGRAATPSIEGPEHVAIACSLLLGQPAVRGNGAPVKARKQSIDRLDPVEAFGAERHNGGTCRQITAGTPSVELKVLSVPQLVPKAGRVVVAIARGLSVAISYIVIRPKG